MVDTLQSVTSLHSPRSPDTNTVHKAREQRRDPKRKRKKKKKNREKARARREARVPKADAQSVPFLTSATILTPAVSKLTCSLTGWLSSLYGPCSLPLAERASNLACNRLLFGLVDQLSFVCYHSARNAQKKLKLRRHKW